MDETHGLLELAFPEIRVIDWPRAVRWYVEILGLRLVLEDVTHQFALLEAGASRLALKRREEGTVPGSNVRLVFRVRDVDVERDRLLACGVQVGPPQENRAESYRSLNLVDCEGTPLTLFAWTETRSVTQT